MVVLVSPGVSWVVWAGAGDLVVGMLVDMLDWVSDTGF